MRVIGLSFPASGSSEKSVGSGSANSPSGSVVGTEVSMAGTGADVPATHIGLGTRTNPYDLRRGLGLQLTCETTCGYPNATINWLVSNETTSKPGNGTISPNHISSDECDRSTATRLMTTTKSTLMVQCVQLGLVGLNQVECAVSGRQYSDPRPTRHVYVLYDYELNEQRLAGGLSADPRSRRRGERPMLLTNGEVVGIAVGSAMAFILLFAGCLIIRGQRKDSPLPFNGHFLGQRV
ncbi:unnamed protein product [Echinostoma caproni]|uniref:Ig-like domain-containing protein n=1 Tax=Echinostoma caproni TaxID=27848 RepID=A0A183A6G8_9TREM|nr:unnamed protein product [Echinostoma caproni]